MDDDGIHSMSARKKKLFFERIRLAQLHSAYYLWLSPWPAVPIVSIHFPSARRFFADGSRPFDSFIYHFMISQTRQFLFRMSSFLRWRSLRARTRTQSSSFASMHLSRGRDGRCGCIRMMKRKKEENPHGNCMNSCLRLSIFNILTNRIVGEFWKSPQSLSSRYVFRHKIEYNLTVVQSFYTFFPTAICTVFRFFFFFGCLRNVVPLPSCVSVMGRANDVEFI